MRILLISLILIITSCARDLDSNSYVSNSTMNLTVAGKVLSQRAVIIKNTDKPSNNIIGGVAGGFLGKELGSNLGKGNGRDFGKVAGAVAGAIIGSKAESKLGESKGIEYVVKIDTSKINSANYQTEAIRRIISSSVTDGLVTIIQGGDLNLRAGDNVYVVFSENRTRIIPAN